MKPSLLVKDLGGLALPAERTAPEGTAREQLVSLIRDNDNRLVPFRAFLVSRLARLEDEEVTHDLLDLYTQRSIPTQLKQTIATALQSRRNGARAPIAKCERVSRDATTRCWRRPKPPMASKRRSAGRLLREC
jgi:hypothetical protein